MAKIHEEVILIKLSKLTKDGDVNTSPIISEDIQAALEQVTQELVGEGVIVEVQTS